ncbi:hypothetical protein LNKW23_00550 [Paralimibaculum aggregatum]|uniref:PepSY domain-containing protein n=1 Tax=Paralimibaculum aggregatum TaxID=3036245 RepID=A0ABQ6LJ86_9RHOB|nr:hypothetical protein LNKW23_00550 [Limibaculum sp. NKW23]
MLSRRALAGCLLAVAGALLGAGSARAQGRRQRQGRQGRQGRRSPQMRRADRQALREAVRRGEVRPLRELMAEFEARTGFEIIDIRLRRHGGDFLYGFKVITEGGLIDTLVMNAATGEIMTLRDARTRYR